MKAPVAIYKVKSTGQKRALRTAKDGRLFVERFGGPMNPSTSKNFGPLQLLMLKDAQANGEIEWIKTPQTPYHVWHICTCQDCAPHVNNDPTMIRSGGRIKTHHQSTFDEHLRYVENEDIGTFPTIEDKS